MLPSDRQIDGAIDSLDPAAFQAFAEVVVSRGLPEQFRELSRLGANARGETIRGWPDAYAHGHDGVVLMEATRSTNWMRHLRADIGRVRDLGEPVAAYAAVVWANRPPIRDITSLVQDFEAAGVPRGGVFLLFRQDLVARSQASRFADIWQSMLGLPSSSLPFQPIEQVPIFGADPRDYPMSLEEIRDEADLGDTAEDVDAKLRSQRGVLVWGAPGAGKTSLAAGLGLRGWQSCLYLDFAAYPLGINLEQVAAVMISRSDRELLLVLDNVHLDIGSANALVGEWRRTENDSALLVLGRKLDKRRSVSGGVYPNLAGLPTFVLVPDARVLRSVLQRVCDAHHLPSGYGVRKAVDMEALVQAHAGDLVLLGAALSHSASVGKPLTEVRAGDALQFVRERYLDPLEPTEIEVLMVVATLASIEFAVADRLVAVPPLKRSLSLGIVRTLDTPAGRSFTTAHPQLGHLLLRAYEGVGPRSMDALAACATSSELGGEVLLRLVEYGRSDWAIKIIDDSRVRQGALARLIESAEAANLPDELALLEQARVLTARELDQALVDCVRELAQLVLEAEPRAMAVLLEHLRRRMPSTHAALTALLAHENYPTSLASIATRSSLDNALNLLRVIATHVPTVLDLLRSAISKRWGVDGTARWLLMGPSAFGQADRIRLLRVHPDLEAEISGFWATERGRTIFADAVQDGFDLDALRDPPEVGRRKRGRNDQMLSPLREAAFDAEGVQRLVDAAAGGPGIFWRVARLAIAAKRRALLEPLIRAISSGSLDTSVVSLVNDFWALTEAFRWLQRRRSARRHEAFVYALVERIVTLGATDGLRDALLARGGVRTQVLALNAPSAEFAAFQKQLERGQTQRGRR